MKLALSFGRWASVLFRHIPIASVAESNPPKLTHLRFGTGIEFIYKANGEVSLGSNMPIHNADWAAAMFIGEVTPEGDLLGARKKVIFSPPLIHQRKWDNIQTHSIFGALCLVGLLFRRARYNHCKSKEMPPLDVDLRSLLGPSALREGVLVVEGRLNCA